MHAANDGAVERGAPTPGRRIVQTIVLPLARLLDVRRDEVPLVARAALTLFLLIAGHTMLETARDTLLLSRFAPGDLAIAYIAVAIGVVPLSSLAAFTLTRIGPMRTLRASLVVGSAVLGLLFIAPMGRLSLLALYVATALVSTALVPLFWNLIGEIMSVTQGRRLLGPVSGAGVLGGAGGSLLAMGAVHLLPVTGLFLTAAVSLAVAYLVVPNTDDASVHEEGSEMPRGARDAEPFLGWIALLVAISTVTFVLLDFTVKWRLARSVAPEVVPVFVSRYYAVLNVFALVTQVLIGRLLIRRASVATAVLAVPLVFVGGAIATIATGSAESVVLAFKGVDGSLRNSIHRVTTELLYLPLSPIARGRAKSLIDGALVRVVQGSVGLGLLGLTAIRGLNGTTLTFSLLVAAALWLLAAWSMRGPYVALLRHSVAVGSLSPLPDAPSPFDLESAETLVEFLSNDDPNLVVAAMNALARRNLRLVPAVILLHHDEGVLVRALMLFRESARSDWYALAERHLGDPRERIRRVAARALAQHGQLDARALSSQTSAGAQGFLATLASQQHEDVDPATDPTIIDLLDRRDAAGEEGRLGILSAIGLSRRDPRLVLVLDRLANEARTDRAWRIELARAVLAQRAAHALPVLMALLDRRDGRDVVRSAIASFGAEAIEVLRAGLSHPATPHGVRIHIPNTLTRIGSREAAELALDTIEHHVEGVVRFKAIRALGRMVAERRIKVDGARVERLALTNLVEHFRLLGLRVQIATTSEEASNVASIENLLQGMLDDKIHQSVERAFRLLKIAHPDEDLHRVHDVYASGDKRVRANSTELVDDILRRCRIPRLRKLLRLLGEERSAVDVTDRAAPLLDEPPVRSRREALLRLSRDHDPMMADLARLALDMDDHETKRESKAAEPQANGDRALASEGSQ